MNKQAQAPEGGLLDVLIVGAGWSGMYMLHRVRTLGLKARVFEAGPSVGGTWYWNRYPGLRCDVDSLNYSYSFDGELQQEWNWSERYAAQPEILRYANHVADRHDLRSDIVFNKRVKSATFNEQANAWRLLCEDGTEASARYLIMATGCLSKPKPLDIAGADSFKGEVYHTTDWPHQPVDFRGKRVGVIGTGSSGIQAIPIIAEQAEHLTVYQRTPSYSVPAMNAPLQPQTVAEVRARYSALREEARHSLVGIPTTLHGESVQAVSAAERDAVFEGLYQAGQPFAFMTSYADLLADEKANRIAADFVEAKIRQRVKDPALAEELIPSDQFLFTRRICLDTNYYETFNRDNVSLVNLLKHPIRRITADGIETEAGEQKLDCLVFATGYDAMTGALLALDIRGRGGESLRDKWAQGPRSLLGLSIAGFPNLFTITGPGSPSVLSNMIVSIEQHVEWIAGCLAHLQNKGLHNIEATAEAEENWTRHVDEVAHTTLFPRGNTWYMGANVTGKPRMFMPYIGVGGYRQICTEIADEGYRGFALS